MNSVFYEEIRRLNKQLSNDDKERLCYEIKRVSDLAILARKEGLLALERVELDMYSVEKYLRHIIVMFVDGIDWKTVEEILTVKYFANDLNGIDALIYIIYMEGMKSIVNMEDFNVLLQRMLACVPESISKKLDDESGSFTEKSIEDINMDIVDKVSENTDLSLFDQNQRNYMARVDHVFEELSDRSIQRLLRDVENAQIEIIIKGLHEPAKRKLFNNLSKRLAVMIANDVNVMDRISASEIVNEAKKTVECLKSLYNQAEIFDLDIDNLP